MSSIIEFILVFGFFVGYPLVIAILAIKVGKAFIDEIYKEK